MTRAASSATDKELGRRGEALAADFLKSLGHKILATNYQTPQGELDLVTLDLRAGRVCFVEVKTRRDEKFAPVESALTAAKRRHLLTAARQYLSRQAIQHTPFRFDFVAVVLPPGGAATIRHWPDCF